MLPKSKRLKSNYLINLAFKKKQVINTSIISLFFLYEIKDLKSYTKKILPAKSAFIVSTKIDKRAVKRNLYKRRMKASYLHLAKPIYFTKHNKIYIMTAFIWLAKENIKKASYLEIKNTIKSLLDKLEAINLV